MRCMIIGNGHDLQGYLAMPMLKVVAQDSDPTASQHEFLIQYLREYCDTINGVRFNSYKTILENPPTGGPGEASLSLASRFDLLGSSGILQGFEYIEYPPFEDAPQEGDYSLLASLAKAIAAVAVVAVIAVVAVATGGIALGLGLALIGGAAVFAGCVVYNDYQNGNVSDFGAYLSAAICGAIVGAAIYGLAGLAIKAIPYVAKAIEFVSISYGIPFLQIYATTIATAGGYTLAITNSVRLTNFLVSKATGQENALVNIFFEEGTAAYNNAINVYRGIASFLNYANVVYLTLGIGGYVLDKLSQSTPELPPFEQSEASSKTLRENLIQSGETVPEYKNAAHHIVAGGDRRAKVARKILESFRIDINSPSNGTFLPTVRDVSNATYHPSIHSNAYYLKVEELLSAATSRVEVLEILEFIKEGLLNGTFP